MRNVDLRVGDLAELLSDGFDDGGMGVSEACYTLQSGKAVLSWVTSGCARDEDRWLTIPEVKSNHFFPSVVHTQLPSPRSMISSFDTRPIPGVMYSLAKAGVKVEAEAVRVMLIDRGNEDL